MEMTLPDSELVREFLHESDRKEIVEVASTYLNTALKSIVSRVDVNKERQRPHESLEMYKCYQKILKVSPGKEKDILVHMKELYAKICGRLEEKDEISDSEVIQFCAGNAFKPSTKEMRATNRVKPLRLALNMKTLARRPFKLIMGPRNSRPSMMRGKEFRNKITDAATAKVKVKVRLLEVVRRVEDLNIKRLKETQEKWMRQEKKEEREHKMVRFFMCDDGQLLLP